jgi:hypothetical protein
MRLAMILMSVAALVWLGGCSDSTEPSGTDSDLRGQVVDALGQPVAGATVVLQYEVDPPVGGAFDKPQTGLRFELPEDGLATLWVSSFCDDDTVRMVVDGELPAGQHMFVWDGKDDEGLTMPDGVYHFHLVTASGASQQPFLLLYLGYDNLPEDAVLAPLAVTDARGGFALSQACLPLGFVFDTLDEVGQVIGQATVTRSVRVWAYDPHSGVLADSPAVTIDPDNGAVVTVTVGD